MIPKFVTVVMVLISAWGYISGKTDFAIYTMLVCIATILAYKER